jgi:hypothetical protein
MIKADQEALSAEAARYLEDDGPELNQEFEATFGGPHADNLDDCCMQDASDDECVCICPMCHHQPVLYQMGWFLCVCGFRLNVKMESLSVKQLNGLLERSTNNHHISGCRATPFCVLKACRPWCCM